MMRTDKSGSYTIKKSEIVFVLAAIGVFAWIVFGTSPSKPRTEADWTAVSTNQYEVKIPDGWTVARASSTIVDGDCASCLKYSAGKQAVVLTGGPAHATSDMLFPFFVTPQAAGESEATFFQNYQKTGTIAAKNAGGNTYHQKIRKTEEGGFAAGSELYGYAISRGDNTIFIRYVTHPSRTDYHKIVEKLINTLEIRVQP
jgi:hypothetical protein